MLPWQAIPGFAIGPSLQTRSWCFKRQFSKERVFFLEKKPKLAGIFTRILLIILVNLPKKELFAYLLLLFAVSLMEMEGWGGTDLCNEETKQGFRSAKPPSGALNQCWDFRLSVEG